MCVETIGHELKLSIRGHKGDGAIIVESRESHTLMKLDILQLDSFGPIPYEGERERGTNKINLRGLITLQVLIEDKNYWNAT